MHVTEIHQADDRRPLGQSGIAVAFAEDGVGGLALCRALRRDPATKAVPILVVSGNDAAQMRAAFDAGCDAVLAKACTGALLVRTINRLLRLPSGTPAATWNGLPISIRPRITSAIGVPTAGDRKTTGSSGGLTSRVYDASCGPHAAVQI